MLALHLPKDYRPGMGFYATESCLLESDPLPENRVGGFRTSSIIHARRFPAQIVEPYQEAVTFDSSTVSGVGEWLSNDPIGISGGLNQYVFCNNNPVNFRDLFGLCKDTMRELSWWEFNVKTPSRNIGRNVWNTVTDPTVAMGLAMVTEGLGGGLAILSEAGTVVETTTVAQDILSGAKTIGRAGNNSGVRVVESVDELNQAFSKLSQGGKVINAPGYKGTMVELVDGTRVGLRSVSKTGGPTSDIFGGGNSVKIHVGP